MGHRPAAAASDHAAVPGSLIGRLAAACREHLLREKIVVVPDFRIGRQIGEALARENTGWLNLRFVTLPALAHGAAAEALATAGLRAIGPAEALERIRAVMTELGESGTIPYFAGASDRVPSRGLVRAIHKAAQWLRLDGVTAESLDTGAFTIEAKGRDLQLILRRYEARLTAGNELDPPGLFAFAAAALAPPRGGRGRSELPLVFRYADHRYFQLEEDFLRAFAPDGWTELPRERVFGLARPRLYPAIEPVSAAAAGSAGPPPAEAPEGGAPPRAAALGALPVMAGSGAERLAWLFAPETAPDVPSRTGPDADRDADAASDREEAAILCGGRISSGRRPTIGLFRAIGAANECREILRRVLASRTPLDDVEIVTPPGSAYSAMLHLQSLRLGVPMTFACGLPLEHTRPGRALSGFLDWVGLDYREIVLRRMLEAGEIDLAGAGRAAGAGEAPSGARAARLLRLARIGWGRDRTVDRLAALKAEFEAELEAGEPPGPGSGKGEGGDDGGNSAAGPAVAEAWRRRWRDLEGLRAAVADLVSLVPPPDAAGGLDFQALCRGALAFIESFAAADTDLDRAARETIADRLRGLIEAATGTSTALPAGRAIVRLRQEAAGWSVADSPPRPGRLHVSDGCAGGFAGRRVVFVCGLDAAAFPGAEHQDPVLLDREKERLSDRLPTSADLLRERLYDMAAMLADLGRARRRVIFSYSSYDVTDERASAPSSLVLQVYRLLSGRIEAGYVELEKALGPAPSPAPGEARRSAPVGGFIPDLDAKALDGLDWWLRRIAPDGAMRNALKAVNAAFPALHRGWTALTQRESAELTAFDGVVRIDRGRHLPAGNPELRVSPSRLERLAECPYGYFLSHVLGIRPPDDPEFDPTRWLDPRDRGTLVHEILAEFMAGLRERGRPLDARRDRGRLLEIAAARLAAWREKVPPPSERIYEREAADVLEGMEIFLRMEARRPGLTEPLLFEHAFEDLEVDIGGGRRLRISGFIDRVDRIGPGLYRVLDYKTGSPRKYELAERFGKGTVLQYALYALAAEKLLKERGEEGEVVEAGYAFPTRRGDGGEVLRPVDREACAEVLGVLMTIIDEGLFIPGKDARCERCEYAPACGRAPELARAKVPGGRRAEDKAQGEAARRAVRIAERLKDYA